MPTVLDGIADANASVTLQLYSDDADAVPRFLEEHRIPAEARSRHVRPDHERGDVLPVRLFSAKDLTVLPADVLRQAPLSVVDEKPMKCVSASPLRCWRTMK